MSFTLKQLAMAYRKAKVDLYYSPNASVLAIAKYESRLTQNLQLLVNQLNGRSDKWVTTKDFLGGWTLNPKSISWTEGTTFENDMVFSSPAAHWQSKCKRAKIATEKSRPTAEFRLMANCSLDFHVLSALWMQEVGHKYDAALTNCAYGNRLRRKQDGEINRLSLGSLKPYLKSYRDWRDDGIRAMRHALNSGINVVAVTADVKSFYHELNPDFMLDDGFNKLFAFELSEPQQKLHRLFVSALGAWAQRTPPKKGLPVGLPASAVVANIALIELDRIMERDVVPLYYGRYVDDIMLVMKNGAKFESSGALWKWLFARSDGKLNWDKKNREQIRFSTSYLSKSNVLFANKKNKVFLLEGESGLALVDSIAMQIQQRASEWRALPNLPELAGNVGTDLIAAMQSDGETSDCLGKTDVLTMRRAGFAIKLRDFEAYERDLLPDDWANHRHAFLKAFTELVLVLPDFFQLGNYLPRVVRLATACQDFAQLRGVIEALYLMEANLSQSCILSVKSCEEENGPTEADILAFWKRCLWLSVYEGILAAFPAQLSKISKQAWKSEMAETWSKLGLEVESVVDWVDDVKSIQAKQAFLFAFDLAHMPFRFIGLPKEMISQRGIPKADSAVLIMKAADLLPEEVYRGIARVVKWIKIKKSIPHGLVFATRPYNLAELFVLAEKPFAISSRRSLREAVLAIRGFDLNDMMPKMDKNDVLQIACGEPGSSKKIAVSSWKNDYENWLASVTCAKSTDLNRYLRLTRLINNVLAQPKCADYFVLPELALPAQWFMRFAINLQRRGISFITGIEYLHDEGCVRNQVWAALSHTGIGFPSTMIYRQDKQRPALHEEQELRRLANLEMVPSDTWPTPPIIQHGSFRFSVLVWGAI